MTDDLKVGDVFARVSHGKIVAINGDLFEVENEAGFRWTIAKGIVAREFCFAGAHSRSEKVTVSAIERIFKEGIGSNVFTVTFTKKPDVGAGVAAVDGSGWDALNKTKRRKVIADVLTGASRTLIGRLNVDAYRAADSEPETLGRMKVVDLQVPAGERNERMIDLRTVTELIVGGVRYHTA